MKKILVLNECMECRFWTFGNHTDYCKNKNKIIPDGARVFPKRCPLEKEKKFAFFRRLFKWNI